MRPSFEAGSGRDRGAPALAPASGRRVPAHTVFFPLAAAYSVLALPASVASMHGIGLVFPGFAGPIGHAQEMVFGFALAVIAGNQLGPLNTRFLILLVALWVAGRVAFVFAPQSAVAIGANVSYAALLGWRLVPRLVGSATKWRNAALPAVLAAICATAIVAHLARGTDAVPSGPAVIGVTVPLLGLLMLFMGGRLLAAAVASQRHRQGDRLAARVQPRLEGVLIVVMGIATVAAVLSALGIAVEVQAVALMVAGALAAVRMLRWKLRAVRGRPDLLCLGAGYAWLSLGLFAYGVALACGREQTTALHIITVGGLGTLALNVMAMTQMLKSRQSPARSRLPVWGTLLLAVAVAARVAGGLGIGDPVALLLLASACWSGAFALLLPLLLRRGFGNRRVV